MFAIIILSTIAAVVAMLAVALWRDAATFLREDAAARWKKRDCGGEHATANLLGCGSARPARVLRAYQMGGRRRAPDRSLRLPGRCTALDRRPSGELVATTAWPAGVPAGDGWVAEHCSRQLSGRGSSASGVAAGGVALSRAPPRPGSQMRSQVRCAPADEARAAGGLIPNDRIAS